MEQDTAAGSAQEDEVRRVWDEVDSAIKNHTFDEVLVNIGDCAIGDSSKVLLCLGLGSCVGVVIYDSNAKIAGLAHVMLASKDMASSAIDISSNLGRFADTAVPYLIDSLVKKGCSKSTLRAKIAGGGQMFKNSSDEMFDIGRKNVESVKAQLLQNNIPLVASDTLGSEGRTMKFVVAQSRAFVRTKSRMIEL